MPTDWTRRTSLSADEVDLLRSLDFETDEPAAPAPSADQDGEPDGETAAGADDREPGTRQVVRIAAASAIVVVAMMVIILLRLPPVALLAVLAAVLVAGSRRPRRRHRAA